MFPEDILRLIVSSIDNFVYRLVCRKWSEIWNYRRLVEVMIEKDDPKYLEKIYEKHPSLIKQHLYGGSRWRIGLRELGLIQIGEAENIIHAINLWEEYLLINTYRDKLLKILPLLAQGVLRNIGRKVPKNQIIVRDCKYYGKLCGRNNPIYYEETNFLLGEERNKCRYATGRGHKYPTHCNNETVSLSLCNQHLMETFAYFKIYGRLFKNPDSLRIRCLLEYERDVECDGKYEEGHGVCYENSYLYGKIEQRKGEMRRREEKK